MVCTFCSFKDRCIPMKKSVPIYLCTLGICWSAPQGVEDAVVCDMLWFAPWTSYQTVLWGLLWKCLRNFPRHNDVVLPIIQLIHGIVVVFLKKRLKQNLITIFAKRWSAVTGYNCFPKYSSSVLKCSSLSLPEIEKLTHVLFLEHSYGYWVTSELLHQRLQNQPSCAATCMFPHQEITMTVVCTSQIMISDFLRSRRSFYIATWIQLTLVIIQYDGLFVH